MSLRSRPNPRARLWAMLLVAAWAMLMILPAVGRAQDRPQDRGQDMGAWRRARAQAFTGFNAAHPDAAQAAAAVKVSVPTGALGGLDAPLRIWPVGAPPLEVWDAPEAPQMVLVPPGEFTLGPAPGTRSLRGNEAPRQRVRLSRPLLVAKYPITVGEFDRFTSQTHHDAGAQCWTFEDEDGHIRQGRNWKNPGFSQAPNHPVLCVSMAEVKAYVAWLNKITGQRYRLLTEAEYEYVNRAGSTGDFWWGDDVGVNKTNCDGCGSLWDNRRTSPVGSFAANAFGLYDTTGDTWVWTSDCFVDPKASPVSGGACGEYAIRGGAWHGTWQGMRVFSRFHHTPDTHSATLGFRLAREP